MIYKSKSLALAGALDQMSADKNLTCTELEQRTVNNRDAKIGIAVAAQNEQLVKIAMRQAENMESRRTNTELTSEIVYPKGSRHD
ncbi:MAG: hypothetical protein HRU18_23500 [Pseudoalteromonas sp.]|uniref:hypothetical protein n=1 Tax=Pseudoalteromonas sp. TaxID=53249 RepID=UPI001D560B2E|nr:hypothetical protein [Pseudoalteromonas sp.]NRA81176.1 hypothetical protein [Pseudoalteromonas sp.]